MEPSLQLLLRRRIVRFRFLTRAASRHVAPIGGRVSGVAAKDRARASQMCWIWPRRLPLLLRPHRRRCAAAAAAFCCLGSSHKQVNLNTLDYIYPLKTDCYPKSRLMGKLILHRLV